MTSVPHDTSDSAAGTGFGALPLSPAMLANLEQLGYRAMTAIQAAALPPALLGRDIIAQATTGSGKTATFAQALLANLNPRRFAVQATVLCPTRELADQVTSEVRRLARAEDNVKVVTLCGGWIEYTLPVWVGVDPLVNRVVMTRPEPSLARDPKLCEVPF